MKGRVFLGASLAAVFAAVAFFLWRTPAPVSPAPSSAAKTKSVPRATAASPQSSDPDLSITLVPPIVAAAATTLMATSPQAPVALSQPPPAPVKNEIAIEDGKTIDFSPGIAVVKDEADEKAALARALKEMDEATKNVTFGPTPGSMSNPAAKAGP